MKQEKGKDFSISNIHKIWLSVQNKRYSNLNPINRKQSNNECIIDKKEPINRKQSNNQIIADKKKAVECFHVFVKGYNSYTIFYDNKDRVHFLLILDEETKRYQAKISAFILMDNHIHLQIITSQLSRLMRSTLQRYSRKIKNKYGIEGPIFNKKFGRSRIFSYLLAKENLLYILSNASREHICATHRDYIWSSYNSHPELIELRKKGMLPLPGEHIACIDINGRNNTNSTKKTQLQTPKRARGSLPSKEKIAKTDINQIITIDTTFMQRAYKNLGELDCSIHSYRPLNEQLLSSDSLNTPQLNTRHNNKYFKLTPDAEVVSLFKDLLDGRKLNTVTENERLQIINILRKEKNATKRQISSILRI